MRHPATLGTRRFSDFFIFAFFIRVFPSPPRSVGSSLSCAIRSLLVPGDFPSPPPAPPPATPRCGPSSSFPFTSSSLLPDFFPCSRSQLRPGSPIRHCRFVCSPTAASSCSVWGTNTRFLLPASASSRSSFWTSHPRRHVRPPDEVGVPKVIQRFAVELRPLHLYSTVT